MSTPSNDSSPNGDGTQKRQDNSRENTIPVPMDSTVSVETASQIASLNGMDGKHQNQGLSSHSHKSFPVGDFMAMEGTGTGTGTGESISAVTDTNISASRTSSLDVGVGPDNGKTSLGSAVPPTRIYQQIDDDSVALINLDSLQVSERESDVSDLNGIIPKGDDNKTSWLNIDSSSTSQGSQGSYAHQVPNLLGSYGSNGTRNEMDYKPSAEFGKPQQSTENTSTHLSPEKHRSAHTESSHFPQIDSPQIDTPQDSNLTDILGPKGEPVDDGLGIGGEPLQSDLDDILGPQTCGKSSDLDDTLGPYEGSTVGPSTMGHSLLDVPVVASSSVPGERAHYNSEYAHFRDIDKQPNEPKTNTTRPSSLRVNDTTVYCSPADTPVGDPSGRTTNITPSATRRAIENISKALNGREETDSSRWSRWSARQPSILSEAHSCENATAINTIAETQSVPNVKNTSEHVEAQDQEPPEHSLSTDVVESEATWESKGTGTSQVSNGATGFMSATSNAETTIQGGGGTTFASDTLSPNNGSSTWEQSSRVGTFSPNSYTEKTGFTLSHGGSGSDNGFSYSSNQRDALNSDFSGSNDLGQRDSRRQINELGSAVSSQFSTTDHGGFTPTGRTAGTEFTYATRSNSAVSSQFSTTEHGGFTPTGHTAGTEFTYATKATSASGILSMDESIDDTSRGGRMWQEAQIEAKNSKDRPLSPRAKKFAESIMARTRSRADTDALLDNSSRIESMEKPTRSMINVNAQEEGGIIQSTAIARKRGRVIQLLTIGLLSFLTAFLGGFFVLSSCHFVSVAVEVGDDATEFDLHFGLWKYSPVDSAFQGYTYCSQYDDVFVSGAPWFGRISSLIALAGGGFSLLVLWLYLVFGRCALNVWNMAIFSAAMSGGLQLCTLSVLTGPICREEGCVIGPAGIISIIAGCCYFVLAFEMHYNTPLVNVRDDFDPASSRVGNFEMSDFEYGAKAYVHRIAFGNTNPYPTLNQDQGGHYRRHNGATTNGPYIPPSALV